MTKSTWKRCSTSLDVRYLLISLRVRITHHYTPFRISAIILIILIAGEDKGQLDLPYIVVQNINDTATL